MVCIIMVFENCTNCFDVIMILITEYRLNYKCKENASLLGYPGNAVKWKPNWNMTNCIAI